MLDHISIPLGRDDRGEEAAIDLVAASHLLASGASRSGKTNAVMNAISIATSSVPEVQFAGCDVSSLLIHPLRELPGAKFRSAGGGNFEPHVRAMNALVAELDRRIGILLDREVDKLTEFSSDLPLLICLFDEVPALFALAEADDAATGRKVGERCAPAIRRAFRRLTMESAKVGMRIWAVATRADAAILGGAERSNFGTRLTFRVDGPDALRMMHPYASDIDAHAFPPGVGLIETPELGLRKVRFYPTTYAEYVAAARRASV
jgi:S-DNA-T family DNA segregation ATPase FtsK/SpoIIIE